MTRNHLEYRVVSQSDTNSTVTEGHWNFLFSVEWPQAGLRHTAERILVPIAESRPDFLWEADLVDTSNYLVD